MEIDADELTKELGSLCQRRGARGPSLWQCQGSSLAKVCGFAEWDQSRDKWRKLERTVGRLLADHQDERDTLLVALGLHASAPQATLEKRLDWLGSKRHFATRTVRRQLEVAIDGFVRAAVAAGRAASATGDVGHRVVSYHCTITILGDRVRVIERRKIVATRDQLRAIECHHGFPPAAPGEDEPAFSVELVEGGLYCETRRLAGGTSYRVELAQPLKVGRSHEFEVSFELPAARLSPYYVVQPVTPFETVEVTLRFDPRSLPARVWRVNGAMPSEVDHGIPSGEPLVPDPSAEVRVTFDDLCQGRCYGIAWAWP